VVQVNIFKHKGNVTSITLKGHANYGKVGQDIICAAISMATQMTVIGLQEIAHANFEADLETPGFMELIIHNPGDLRVRVLVDTLELTLKQLATQYPENIRFHSH
jgi:uncharacterized protein YsxB (DUF464 family)